MGDSVMALFRKEKRYVSGEVLLQALAEANTISVDQALELPLFDACLNFISGTVAGLEFKLYKETDGEVTEIRNDVRVKRLNDDTKDVLSGYELKRAMVRDYFLYGNGYTYRDMYRNEVRRLVYIPCLEATGMPGTDVFHKDIKVFVQGIEKREWEFIKLLRNTQDGWNGEGLVESKANLLAGAYALQLLSGILMRTGGVKRGVLSSENKLTEDQMNELKRRFADLYSNKQNGFIVLNKGLQFKETSNNAVELQLSENRKNYDDQICSLFGMSREFFNGKMTEDEAINTIKTAVMPVVVAFEAALNQGLLLDKEKNQGFYWMADTKTLLRASMLSRYRAYTEAVKAGWITKNEIRYEEDYNAIEGLDVISGSLGEVIYDVEGKQYFTPNMNAINQKNEGGVISADRDQG